MWTTPSKKSSDDDAYERMREQMLENKRREATLKKVKLTRELDEAKKKGDQREIQRITRELQKMKFSK